MSSLGFLHTSRVHVAAFDRLVDDVAASTTVEHRVDESLLADARSLGLAAPGLRARIAGVLAELAAADVIVCTCSTIGGLAEAIGSESGRRVVRVDRPMAEAAVRIAGRSSGRVCVVAAVDSTLEPTRDLIDSVAADAGVAANITIDPVLVPDAWARFEAGDQSGYLRSIAVAVTERGRAADVVVLAQASMAGAVALVDLDVPVLSSPRLAVESLLG